MMQITGKSVPRRGATLFLALMLGAGLALTGCGDDSSTTTPAPAPAPAPPAPDPVGVPGGLKATAGVGFIEFSWEAVEGATGYEVQMTMTEGDFSTEVATATVTETMHRFPVDPGASGWARVRAHEGDRQSDWSETATGMSMVAPIVLGTPMPTMSDSGPDYIEWSWPAVEDAAGYVINVAATMEGLDAAQIQFAQEPKHREEGVDPGATMYIRVRATGGDRENPVVGDWSDAVMGMSMAAPLMAPTLTVSSTGHDHIEFSWDPVEGATGYEIQMSMMEDDFSSVATAIVEATMNMHRFTVDPETTGYARIRVHEGDRQSDWSETATGMSLAAPIVLAVPTPRVNATGHDFIEWEWDAVESAETYQVQVADSEDGLAGADPTPTEMTRHRVDTDPEMEMYIRVRAVAGAEPSPVTSDWSDAVMGTSDAAPIPFTVSMTPPEAGADKDCMGQAFCPDGNRDPKKAMASVNQMMMVTASRDTQVTPMFVEGAPAVTASAGGDTPFMHSNFMAMQTTVAGDGVSFMLQPVTVGAGQEPKPMGDAMYITCGPFRCSDASDETPSAPEITLADSEVCENFEVDLELVKGAALNGDYRAYDSGVDVGWVYTASHAARVTHEFENVTAGTASMTVPGTSLSPTSVRRSLSMTAAAETSSSKVNKFGAEANRDEVAYTVAADHPTARTQSDPGPIRNGVNDCLSIGQTGASNNRGSGGWSYYSITRSLAAVRPDVRPLRRPENCFRIVTDGLYAVRAHNADPEPLTFYNYLPGYSVHVDPVGGVSWAGSSVSDWGDGHPFDELKCPRVTFRAADQLDVCADFEDEVEAYWGAGIGSGGSFRVEFETTGTTNVAGRLNEIVIRNKARRNNAVPTELTGGFEYRPPGSRHANLWLVDDSDGVAGTNMAFNGTKRDPNLYWMTTNDHAPEVINASARLWRAIMRLSMMDVDGDPKYGDFGKIDQTTGTDQDTYKPDGMADNMLTGDQADHRQCSDADGPGCDATADFDLSGTFTRIQDTDSCTVTIEQSITCTWDADGDQRRGGLGEFPVARSGNRFISCEAN